MQDFAYFLIMVALMLILTLQTENVTNEVLTLPKAPLGVATRFEYAVQVDVRSAVDDFHKRIPQMAYTVSHC